MDSSNAEKAVTDPLYDWFRKVGASMSDTDYETGARLLAADRASRDAEVAELREQLATAEAVIEKVREAYGERFADTGRITTWADARMGDVLDSAPSVVLEDRDREVAARAVEAAGAEYGTPGMSATSTYVQEWLRERAAAIRKGDTNA